MGTTRHGAVLASSGLLAMALFSTGTVSGAVGGMASASAATATCHGKPATVVKTQPQADQAATDGDDVVLIATDEPYFEGGPGDDTVCVAPGLHVGTGVFGGPGDDWIRGGEGDDIMSGDSGDDQVYGAAGDDFLSDDSDPANAPDGADLVSGGPGDDRIDGRVNGAADVLRGGAGRDALAYPEVADPAVRLDLAAGTARARSGGTNDTVNGIEVHEGSYRADLILGSSAGDRIESLGGRDTIRGRAGDDHITSFQGTVYAGPGDDRVSDGEGSPGRRGPAVWLGTGDDTAFSWSGAGRLSAGRGDDRIMLGVIDHSVRMRLRGERGTDTLTWSDCAAALDNRAGRFRCAKVRAQVVGLDRFQANVCGDYYNCSKRGYADVLRGSGRDEVFRGGGGHDRLFGRGGRDLLVGGNGRDVGWGGRGGDRCRLVEVRHSCR